MTPRLALGLALALALSACSYERTNRLGRIDPWPPRASADRPRSVSLRLYGTKRFEGTPSEIETRELLSWNDVAMRAYGESKLFSSVTSTWEPTEIVAEISISKSTGPLKGIALIIGALPFRQTDIQMRTRFRSADGSLLRLVELSEAIRTIGFFYAPRQESPDSLRAILYDLHRATLLQAASAGVLELEPSGETESEEKS